MTKALTAGDYNEQWSRLGDFIRYNPGARHRRRKILKLVAKRPVRTVVDVGCGPGELLVALASVRDDVELVGVDLSDEVIAANREAMPQWRFVEHDISTGPLGEQFDLVLSSEMIEHLDDWRVGARNLAEMVVPGGYLCISVPTGPIYPTERAWGHVEHPTVDELKRVVNATGMRAVHWSNWGFPTYVGLKKATNVRPDFAMRQFGGSQGYGWMQRTVSALLYYATFATFSDTRYGCQIYALFYRPPG